MARHENKSLGLDQFKVVKSWHQISQFLFYFSFKKCTVIYYRNNVLSFQEQKAYFDNWWCLKGVRVLRPKFENPWCRRRVYCGSRTSDWWRQRQPRAQKSGPAGPWGCRGAGVASCSAKQKEHHRVWVTSCEHDSELSLRFKWLASQDSTRLRPELL